MTVYYPEATPALGETKVKLVTSIASVAAPDLSGEVNALTSYDVSLTFRDWNPTVNMNTGSAPKRLGTKAQMPQEGLSQYQPIPVNYPYAPQEDDAHADNAAKAALVSGTIIYALVRKGGDAVEDDFAVGDRVEIWKVRCGRQNFVKSGDDEFAEQEIAQNLFPMEPEGQGVIVA